MSSSPSPGPLEAIGAVLADGASLSSVWGWIGAEALVGAVYGVLGYGMIRALEGLSRRRATLERA